MRVLVADDNRDAVLILQALLTSEGHEVHGVHSGTDVLPALRRFNPDAVLLDIKMPGMSGYEFARRIRIRYRDAGPKLIALSGHFNRGPDRILARIVGFDHHLAKPYEPAALLALLA